MSKTGVIVIEEPDPPVTMDNATTDSTTDTQTTTESSDGTSKPSKEDQTSS